MSVSRPDRRDGVLVVGGGYAGLHAVRAVERLGVDATVIDRTGDHDFVTRLAAVAGGSAPGDDARQPLGRFMHSVEVGSVVSVDDGAVGLADGRRIEADAVVITAGAESSRPPVEGIEHAAGLRTADDAARLGVPTTEDGRIAVDADLRISGMQRTFAAGDVAAHVDRQGDALPMSAQVAVQAGTVAGRNAARVVRGEPTESAALQQLGWVLDLSGGRGLAQLGPLVLASPVVDLIPPLMHHAIDLKDLIEIGGLGALRFVPAPVRALIPRLPGPSSPARRAAAPATP